MRTAGGGVGEKGGPGGCVASALPKHLPLTLFPLHPQIDSFELLYYYDEYLGHCMW